jgi:predicted kinase
MYDEQTFADAPKALPDFPVELILTRGLPASGKTTWARHVLEVERGKGRRIVRVNRDDLRRMALPEGYGKPDFATEKEITAIRDAALEHWLSSGVSVIVDDTNLRMKFARDLADLAQRLGVELIVVDFFDVSLETCLARNENRRHTDAYVPEPVIGGMHMRYLASGNPGPVLPREKAWTASIDPYVASGDAMENVETVLCDVDGTVALLNGRDPYDESCVANDLPNGPVIEVLQALTGQGSWERSGRFDRSYDVVFMSGRSEACRDDTVAWISKHIGIYEFEVELYMRPVGDNRSDHEVKLELFNRHIRKFKNVKVVLDDRDSVVRLWRRLGLTCLQVADGAF